MSRALGVFFFFIASSLAHAMPGYITFPSDIDWVTRRSDHFQIVFRRGSDAFAERSLRSAERAYRLLTPIFPEAPEKTWLVLADFQDSTNGYSIDFPFPHIVIFAAPPQPDEDLSALDDWLSSVILHEYVHTLHLYPVHGMWKVLKTIFGTGVLPNGLMPRLFHEGVATFFETELTRGGRGRGAGFRMWKRMAVNAGVWGNEFSSLDRMDGSGAFWPGGESAYFFGYNLYAELWKRKGAKGIRDLTLAFSSNWPYFLSGPFEDVYGTDYPNLWKEIFKKTTEETKKEIETIERKPLSPMKSYTDTKFHKWDVTLSPDGTRVGYRKFTPTDGEKFEVLDPKTGKTEMFPFNGGFTTTLCWGKRGSRERLVYLKSVDKDLYSTNEIWVYDWKQQKAFRPFHSRSEDESLDHFHRIGCDTDLSRALLYQESKTEGRILEVSLGLPDDDLSDHALALRETRHWDLPTGTWVTSFLISDTAWFALRNGLTTEVYRWDRNLSPKLVQRVQGNLFNLRQGSGNELLAIADFDGRNEIWSLNVKSGKVAKKVALLGGARSFTETSDGQGFWISNYEHGGYDIVESPALPIEAVVPAKAIPTLIAETEPPTPMSATEEYSPLETLVPRTWVPSLLFVPNGAQLGAWVPGFDVSQRHYYDIFGGYDTRGLAFGQVDYTYRFSRNAGLDVTSFLTPSYIIQDRSFLKEWGGSAGLVFPFESNGTFTQWSFSPVFQRLEPSIFGAADQQVGVRGSVSINFGGKQRPLDVVPTRGTMLSFSHSQYFKFLGSYHDFFSAVAQVSQFIPAPWATDHAFYVAARAGYTEGNRFFNSFFQGGGEILFYQQRGFFLNRGFYPGTFLGRRIFNLSTEYHLPLLRVEHGLGMLPFYLKTIHAALVSDITTSELGPRLSDDVKYTPRATLFKVFYESVGLELNTDWVLSYYMPGRFRVGGYHGFGAFGESLYITFGLQAAL